MAGHVCLDIIPAFDRPVALEPGRLVQVGPATISTGGAVSNTGLALQRLGICTCLMGKVGDDLFGCVIRDRLKADGMIVAAGEASSYTVVINPPGVDRTFLHCTGTNDTFGAADIPYDKLKGARLFHFGYPTLMRRMYADGGVELETIFREVKARGLTTSLDVSYPDPHSAAGQADWRAILQRVLPQVDMYLPSLDETLFMLRLPAATPLGDIARQLLDYGVGIAGLKLGDEGLYLRTDNRHPPPWRNRELLAPCFRVAVAGTTGAGDCTIAGFLAAWLHRLPPEAVLTTAVAVGACCCEQLDATSGVPTWSSVQERLRSHWPRLPVQRNLAGWQWDEATQLWRGPNDDQTQ